MKRKFGKASASRYFKLRKKPTSVFFREKKDALTSILMWHANQKINFAWRQNHTLWVKFGRKNMLRVKQDDLNQFLPYGF